ncbi:rifin PIR protein, putative [Plasmodium sp. gorilla clade G2]|uniref:rifin PIR protein, putative n=1 Tax=Plasmodium sp. gorilla clade G2 TaxID=880535 RepID=UPI000D207E20|nr:rifin PIR protein, putative [Plasmodium sp. gorilla clade G2]SOV15269.1 rifin PIR protein, putative [Plasmodium sp. gorilla clade G2]
MKVHYINILLLKFLLNILVHNQRNHKSTITHTPKIHRILCECDLYTSIYDNDPEMKSVMEQFDRQTSKRFNEYDERMQQKRMHCKELCDKEIQNIILKDKIEKELKDKFGALQTNLDSDAIPTCVCEKSVADKTEKFCLNCGQNMEAIAPCWGLFSGVGYTGWTNYVVAQVHQAATDAGINATIEVLKTKFGLESLCAAKWKTIITAENYANEKLLGEIIRELGSTMCSASGEQTGAGSFCLFVDPPTKLTTAIKGHIPIAVNTAVEKAAAAEAAEAGKLAANTSILHTTIIASIVAIVVIVLVMLIIYLILRYRRKKKMKKKLQYIKLLKE